MYTQLQQRDSDRPPVTLSSLGQMRAAGEKIASITAYDASFAALVDAAGADVVLVGDSLGMVIQGYDTTVPVIGIGAGPDTDGQILVLYDILDITAGRKPRFVKNFMEGAPNCGVTVERYVEAVRTGAYPAPEHCF